MDISLSPTEARYFEARASAPVTLLGQGMEGAVYDLGNELVGKVWFTRTAAEVLPLQAFLAELAEQELPFSTPYITSVNSVDGKAISIEKKLTGTPLSQALETGVMSQQQGLDLFVDVVTALRRTTAGPAAKALPLLGEEAREPEHREEARPQLAAERPPREQLGNEPTRRGQTGEATTRAGLGGEATTRAGLGGEATTQAGLGGEATTRAGLGGEATTRAGLGGEATTRAGLGGEATTRAGVGGEAATRAGLGGEAATRGEFGRGAAADGVVPGEWGGKVAALVARRAAESRGYLKADVDGFEGLLERVLAGLSAVELDRPQIVHGDICTPNLLVGDDGQVALLDWGFFSTAGDNTFDAATAAGFYDMYGTAARSIDEQLLDRFEQLGHSRERMQLYRAAYAIATATVYSPTADDGHYTWCVENLKRM